MGVPIPRKQKHRFFEPKKQSLRTKYEIRNTKNFFRFLNNIIEQEKWFFSEAKFLPTRMLNTLKEDKV